MCRPCLLNHVCLSSAPIDQLEEQRLLLQREFRELEGQAKNAEKEAHAHSRQSAIGPDGMVIPARARKKRRLDEELEGLLEAMEVLLLRMKLLSLRCFRYNVDVTCFHQP